MPGRGGKRKNAATTTKTKKKIEFRIKNSKKKKCLEKLGIRSFSFVLTDNRYNKWVGDAVNIVFGMMSCMSKGNQIGNGNIGLHITIDAPHTSLNYAKPSTERRVPFRNYFGKTKNNNDLTKNEKDTLERCMRKNKDIAPKARFFYRASYNVGESVSSDVRTTPTRDMPDKLQNLCNALSSALSGKFSPVKFAFNHVTILFYATDYDLKKDSILDWHADHLKDKHNINKASRSSEYTQRSRTPTVVLTLGDDKKYHYGVRFVGDDGKWTDTQEVENEVLQHGIFHFLNPADEEVVDRYKHVKNQLFGDHKGHRSQFMHMVHCKSSRKIRKKISISLVFRDVDFKVHYSSTNTLINTETGKLIQNKSMGTQVSNNRIIQINNAREKINKEMRLDISSTLSSFAERLMTIHQGKNMNKNKKRKLS